MAPLSLRIGWPAPALLPADIIAAAAQTALKNPDVYVPGLSYGPDEGYMPLRRALAKWLGEFYQQENLSHERIVITGGASQNIGCILQVFTDPAYTQDVLMIAPSYMMIFPTFLDNGFEGRLVAVPEDENGLEIDVLRARLMESEERRKSRDRDEKIYKPHRKYSKYYRHVIYCVPTFSNPSSRCMSLDMRTSLVRLAREFDALIISDDVYDQLQWPADPSAALKPLKTAILPRLVDIDKTLDGGPDRPGADGFGNVTSNGSFSKICGPGVRVGWTEGSEKFAYGVSQCGTSTSGGAPSQLTSTYMTQMLEDGTLQEHIFGRLQPAYASRYAKLISAISKYLLPHGVSLPQPNREIVGGYFVWIELPRQLSADEYVERCSTDAEVTIISGTKFQIPGDQRFQFAHHIRLCFSYVDENLIEEAVRRIGIVLGQMLDELS